ncbi:MAG: sugar-binding domain-containing protein, partial [Terracidiphilus sp.]
MKTGGITRREFLGGCAATALGSAASAWGASASPAMHAGAARQTMALDRGWLFGGKLRAGAAGTGFDDASFARIDLPHTVTPLSWQNWNPETWEDVWIYRRHFSAPAAWRGLRVFAHFDRVMAGATPAVNGQNLEPHLGGFLPFEREITSLVHGGANTLAVAVDGRWLNVPPSGSPRGPASVDYLLPGGITGGVE